MLVGENAFGCERVEPGRGRLRTREERASIELADYLTFDLDSLGRRHREQVHDDTAWDERA